MRTLIILTLLAQPLISFSQETVWWKSTTVYQVYPRSFQDSDGDGIGDLEGIISRLDYIEDLGFNAIWISPFFQSPQKDFGYDVSNYRSIAPEYGDMTLCKRLIDEVHKRDMKIIFDLVMNHTSDQHEWFQNSKGSITSKKRDWYIWRDGRGKNGRRPPNNWKSMIGGNGWHYDETTKQWYWATFLPFQPDLNYYNPEVKEEMLNTARYWLDKGVDGFRLDIFNTIFEDSLFRDNPFSLRMLPSEENTNGFFQKTKYTQNHPKSFEFAKELRAVLDEYEEPKFLVGEVFGDMETISKFVKGDENTREGLHSVFLFKTLKAKLKAKPIAKLIKEFEADFPKPYVPTYVFSNHDKVRSISRYGNDVRKAKLIALLQYTMRGIPFTYYGEELGVPQERIPLKEGKDPLAKKYVNTPQFLVNMSSQSLNRDECRTPMLWDTTSNAGFTNKGVEPWLPVTENYKDLAVSVQLVNMVSMKENKKGSLLDFYKRVIRFRNKSLGKYNKTSNLRAKANVLSYKVSGVDGITYKVILNFSSKKKNVTTSNGLIVLSTDAVAGAFVTKELLYAMPMQGYVIKIN